MAVTRKDKQLALLLFSLAHELCHLKDFSQLQICAVGEACLERFHRITVALCIQQLVLGISIQCW